jgi:hypothetical protein
LGLEGKEKEMIDRYVDRDAAANLLERRWFSSIAAVRAAQAECEVLREVMELAQEAWRSARAQLGELENLREVLGDQLTSIDEQSSQVEASLGLREVMSAA